MENDLKTKGASALELLFIAFVIMKLTGISPINGWSWFGLIAAPIYLQLFIRVCGRVWEKIGLRAIFYATLESKLYDIRLKNAVRDYEKLNIKQRDERLRHIKSILEKTNQRVFEENAERSEKEK